MSILRRSRIRSFLDEETRATGLLIGAALEVLRAVGITSPFVWTLLLRLGTLALSLSVLTYVCAQVAPRIGRSGRRALWLTALFLWFLPLFLSRFTSENLAG